MKLRDWKQEDIPQISQLYFDTVHKVNSQDYSANHIDLWAPEIQTEDFWIKRFDNYHVSLVEDNKAIIGFSEYQYPGHIDCFYVHHDRQRTGVGSLLLDDIEKKAKKEKNKRLFVDASITAKAFFLARGFQIVKQQNKVYKELSFEQYFMEKWL